MICFRWEAQRLSFCCLVHILRLMIQNSIFCFFLSNFLSMKIIKNNKNQLRGSLSSYSLQMDIRDFEDIYKFKLILPILYIVSWIGMFLGPSLFPVVYQRICFIILVYMGVKMLTFSFINFVLLVENCRIISRAQQTQNEKYQPLTQNGE